MKVCPKCKEEKKLDDFGNLKSSKDGKQRICKKCTKIAQNKHYLSYKEDFIRKSTESRIKKTNWLNSVKEKEGCKKCGENRFYCLEHHHLDSKSKIKNVSELVKKFSFNKALEEIEKCIVLCKNCHAEFHYLERENKITIEQYIAR